MAPKTKAEFLILRLVYTPYVNPMYPRILLQHRKNAPTASIAIVREWFDRTMTFERSRLSANEEIRYTEWRIETGNMNIFQVDKCRYDRIMLIMTDEMTHWIFYQHVPTYTRIEGSARISLSYCNCCLNKQYLQVIDSVMQCVHEQRKAKPTANVE